MIQDIINETKLSILQKNNILQIIKSLLAQTFFPNDVRSFIYFKFFFAMIYNPYLFSPVIINILENSISYGLGLYGLAL